MIISIWKYYCRDYTINILNNFTKPLIIPIKCIIFKQDGHESEEFNYRTCSSNVDFEFRKRKWKVPRPKIHLMMKLYVLFISTTRNYLLDMRYVNFYDCLRFYEFRLIKIEVFDQLDFFQFFTIIPHTSLASIWY